MSTALRRPRRAVFTAPSTAATEDYEVPDLGAADVLVRTQYSGISAGTEMNFYRGVAPFLTSRFDGERRLFLPFEEGATPMTYPFSYGYAAVGRVEEVGAEVTHIAVGDLVYAPAAHSSVIVLPAAYLEKLPPLADPRVGVLNANLNTALNGVLDAHPNVGDVVVVSGLGVLGMLVSLILLRSGVTVYGVDSVASRRDLALRYGVKEVFHPGPDVALRVRDLTSNRGADIVVEASGASPALNEAIRIVGYNGTVVALSWYGGTFESLSLSGEFHHNRPRIVATQVGGLSPDLGPLWTMARRQEVVGDLMATLDLSPLMTHEFDIERADEAYALVDSRPDDLIQCLFSYESTESGR